VQVVLLEISYLASDFIPAFIRHPLVEGVGEAVLILVWRILSEIAAAFIMKGTAPDVPPLVVNALTLLDKVSP